MNCVFTYKYVLTDSGFGSREYLENGDMELDFTEDWICHTDCTLNSSSDSVNGSRSAQITNRYHKLFSVFVDFFCVCFLHYLFCIQVGRYYIFFRRLQRMFSIYISRFQLLSEDSVHVAFL